MSLTRGIDVAVRALTILRASQRTVAENIANAAAPGYSRRRVTSSLSESGQGSVQLSSFGEIDVTRVRDRFADAQLRAAVREQADARASSEALSDIELHLNPLGEDSLPSVLGEFTSALTEVSKDAADPIRRISAVRKAEELAAALNGGLSTLSERRTALNDSVVEGVADINRLLAVLAEVNRGLRPEGGDGLGRNNDLLDKRDQALEDLEELVRVNAIEGDFGKMVISINGHAVVEGDKFFEIEAVVSGAADPVVSLRVIDTGITIDPGAGSIAALGRVRDGTLLDIQTGYRSLRDFLVSAAGGSINALHAAGYDAAGALSGLPLFELDGAGGLRVRAEIAANPDLLAAAAAAAVGDGDNAIAMATASEAVISGGKTPQEFLAGLYTNLGFDKKLSDDLMDAAGRLEVATRRRADSVRGVSLDEEAARLLQYQRSYQALVRYISVADELVLLTINMGAR